MKKHIIFLITMTLGCFSCENYLDRDPLDSPSSETFYSNETEVEMAVNAAYNLLDADNTWSHHSYYRLFVGLEDAGQIRMTSVFDQFRLGNVDSQHGGVTAFYRDYYRAIARCHLVIDGMEGIKGKIDEKKWNELRSEARVMRAWSYYNLVVKFGDIPFTTLQLKMQDYADLKRTDEDEIYEYIISEIEDAAKYLPEKRSGSERGRITSGTAWAVGAKAAIYRAYFHNGKAITPDQSYLNKVKELTQKIIDSGAYELYYDQADLKNSYKNLFNYTGENNPEVILQKEFNRNFGKSHNFNITMGSRNYPSGFSGVSPQEYLIHAYEDTLGNTVDKSPYFDPKNPFSGREPRFYQTIVYPRVEGDQDIEMTLNTANGPFILKGFNEVYPGTQYPDINNSSLMREYKTLLVAWSNPINKNYDNHDWYTDQDGTSYVFGNQDATNAWSSRTGYLTWKYWSIEDFKNGTQTSSSLNFMLLRYADILLMNAEVRIELGDDLPKAVEYINMVRARGWGISLNEYLNHPSAVSISLGQDGLRAKVRRERKIELCFEGHRYEDLKRYGATEKALTMDVLGRPKFFHKESESNIPQIDNNGIVSLPWLEGLNGQADDYPNRWWMASNYKNYYDVWPIPQSEFDNGNLPLSEQNPGY